MQRPRDLVQRLPDFTEHPICGAEPANECAINGLVDEQVNAKHRLAETPSAGQHVKAAGLIDDVLLHGV